jgi:hypothetical protein
MKFFEAVKAKLPDIRFCRTQGWRRAIAEGAAGLVGPVAGQGAGQRLLRIGQHHLRLGQSRRQGGNRLT